MGLIPKTTCKRCGKPFDEWRSRCPHCGARRVKASQRAAATTTSRKSGTAANARAAANVKWQRIFGLVILVLAIASSVALINVSLRAQKAEAEAKAQAEAQAQAEKDEQARQEAEAQARLDQEEADRLAAEEAQRNAVNVTSITITFYGEERTEFSMNVGGEVPLKANVYPLDITVPATWSSSDESILTVSEDGVVSGVSPGWAKVIASCGNVSQECNVWVR